MKTDNNIMDFTKEEAANLINYIAARTIKSLHQQGLLKKPSALQQAKSSEAFKSLIEKINAPKYDPCRKFRKGDIVEPYEINGRLPQYLRGCYRYEVIVGEGEMTNPLYVTVKPLLEANCKHLSEIHVNAAFLKLVTPVEEQEPYSVGGSIDGCIIYKNGDYYAEFVNSSDAEKACKLLNAEYRKERENA